MKYVPALTIFLLLYCAAQVAVAAPAITGVSADVRCFNSHTGKADLSYTLADIANGCPAIAIYGSRGEHVRELYPGNQSSGTQSITWDGVNSFGVPVPDGEYTAVVRLASLVGERQPKLVQVFSNFALAGGDFRLPETEKATNASGFTFRPERDNASVAVSDPAGQQVARWEVSADPEADHSYAGPVAINSSGYLYVVAYGDQKLDALNKPWIHDPTRFCRIQIFDPSGRAVASFGSYGSEEGQFGSVSSLAVDRQDNLYVGDLLNHRVVVVDPVGHQITGWDYSAVEVGYSYSPAAIGLNSSGYIFTADSDNGCVDVFSPLAAGTARITVDNTPPHVEATAHGNLHAGWYSSSCRIYIQAADAGSGVREIVYRLDDLPVEQIGGDRTMLTVTGGVHRLSYWSVDNLGNAGAPQTLDFKVDTASPETKATLAGEGTGDWYRSPVNVSLSAEDGGSGVAQTQYSFDGLAWADGSSFRLEREGDNVAYLRSADEVGNLETPEKLVVGIDETAPVIRPSLNGTCPEGWYTSDVVVTLVAEDAGSGIEATEYSRDGRSWSRYTAPFTVQPGLENKVYYRTIDKAGNAASGVRDIPFWPAEVPELAEVPSHSPSPGSALSNNSA